ncbi:MAG: TMEM165/GDT1 family protein [Desulfurococcaceae archaeon]
MRGVDPMQAITVISSTTGAVFLAELGDKTMISTAALAMRTRRFAVILILSTLAFTVANTVAVMVAWTLRYVISRFLVNVIAAALFIGVGAWMLVGDGEEPGELRKGLAPYFLAVVLAEMGDKTQLTVFTVTLATGYPHYVLIGGIVGYAMANALGIIIAKIIGKGVPWCKMKVLASTILVCIGLWLLIETLLSA